jgi:hypothetical protein
MLWLKCNDAEFNITISDRCKLTNIARWAPPSECAHTAVGIQQVDASAFVTAGGAITLIHLRVAGGAHPTRGTGATEGADFIHARCVVLTRKAGALVDVNFTVYSCVANGTAACVESEHVVTGGSVPARVRNAGIELYLTVVPRV